MTIHELWYDERLYAGEDWWEEILRRLEWCEGFIYLISRTLWHQNIAKKS
ncbi:MAG: hypothetical protein Q9P01_06930 [Anaerolineae bacterium]|nr:hypothetical protein [Anaerolineae bacterium]